MKSTDYLKMNVPGYSDAADILKVSENFETIDNSIKSTSEEIENLKHKVSYISPQMFGAVGDGIADDTQAIQNAVDALSYGGTIMFPSGIYITSGIVLNNKICLCGENKETTIIKLKDGSTNHVITGGDFDINADNVNKTSPIGCSSYAIKNLIVDGNKENCPNGKMGIAVYGINCTIDQIEVKNCNNVGIYLESPGSLFSVTAGVNLQNDISNVTCHDNEVANMIYNGQSDSNIYNILCYGTGNITDYIHFKLGKKANGCRVFGVHVWGSAAYGIYNEAVRAYYTNCHAETAEIAQVYTNAPISFYGNLYLNGFDNDSAGLLIDGANSCFVDIRCNRLKKCVKLNNSGGQHNFNVIAYNGSTESQLLDGNLSETDRFEGHLWGKSTEDITFDKFSIKNKNSNDYIINDANFKVRKRGNNQPAFLVEGSTTSTSGLSVIGGSGVIGGTIVPRGTGDNLDIALSPKGNGYVRFGNYTNEVIEPTGYIEIKVANGHIAKIPCKFMP